MYVGGVVLCGGKSSRMGSSKAHLDFGPETMLQRVVRLLGEVVQPVVVVAAAGQDLPPLAGEVLVVRDQMPERGPLEGIRQGLRALESDAEAAYITSCDVPLLNVEFVREMIARLEDNDVAVPHEGRFHHPLAAVYRTRVLAPLEQLLAAERLRPVFLYDQVATCRVPVEELRKVDPDLQTLRNLNNREDYLAALGQLAIEPPDEPV